MSENSKNKPGMSGRRVTVTVLVGLVLVAAWLSYALWSYNRIDAARANTTVSWRELAEPLSKRYGRLEKEVAAGVDSREIDMQLGERFRLAIDRFRTTAQAPLQYVAAQDLEQVLAELASSGVELPPVSSEVAAAIEKHNACLRQETELLASPGGRFLLLFLRFTEPVEFSVTR